MLAWARRRLVAKRLTSHSPVVSWESVETRGGDKAIDGSAEREKTFNSNKFGICTFLFGRKCVSRNAVVGKHPGAVEGQTDEVELGRCFYIAADRPPRCTHWNNATLPSQAIDTYRPSGQSANDYEVNVAFVVYKRFVITKSAVGRICYDVQQGAPFGLWRCHSIDVPSICASTSMGELVCRLPRRLAP